MLILPEWQLPAWPLSVKSAGKRERVETDGDKENVAKRPRQAESQPPRRWTPERCPQCMSGQPGHLSHVRQG